MTELAPTASAERHEVLDTLRGIALFGNFLVWHRAEVAAGDSAMKRRAHTVKHLFVQKGDISPKKRLP